MTEPPKYPDKKKTKSRGYIQSGWLVDDCQLIIRLGHVTIKDKKPILKMMNNFNISRIVIRSGHALSHSYNNVFINVELPLEDPLMEWKFQANKKYIKDLCSLEFEFYPAVGSSIARTFVLPSQLLPTMSGIITAPLISLSNNAIDSIDINMNTNNDRGGLLIGEFNFEYNVITPFSHPKCGSILARSFANTTDVLIGHRGTGSWKSALIPGIRRTHISENTILAFRTASTFGADYVEFDVQLTKDKVPIIYHDFLFSTGSFEIPVNKLTLEQLVKHNKALDRRRKELLSTLQSSNNMKMKPISRFRLSEPPINENFINSTKSHKNNKKNEPFSFADSNLSNKQYAVDEMMLKNKQNDEFYEIKQSFLNPIAPSPSSRRRPPDDSINNLQYLHDHYCTLEEALKTTPITVGFNIEVKYPLEDERIEDGIENVCDANEYTDRILEVVFSNAGQRSIVFSSFHPEICLALALKQPQYPVLFLTTAGKSKYFDTRCNSLFEAIRFARRQRLFGIVCDATSIINDPLLIDAIHKAGLIILTYGADNNDTSMIQLQRQHGIDGIICDHVQHIKSFIDSHPQ